MPRKDHGNRVSRRRFIAGAITAIAAPAVVPASALGLNNHRAPSERIVIGMIGMGTRGADSWRAMMPLPDHQVAAVCDCRRDRALLAQKSISSFYASRTGQQRYDGCSVHHDFRELLAREDIDAVWCCVPDHWHGIMYTQAIAAGKDVYGEKPLTRGIAEGVMVRDAVRRYGAVFQTGTMQRSWRQFPQACELAINGYLGKIHTIHVAQSGAPVLPAQPPCEPPEGFDYDLWTGPAPYVPFDKKRCEWPVWYVISHYCAGYLMNWGAHDLDIACWGCPEVSSKPFDIEGVGVLPPEGMTDTWLTWRMEMCWASGLKMTFSSIDATHPYGCIFVGDQGRVHVNRSGIWAEPASLLSVKRKPGDISLRSDSMVSDDPYTNHTADFFRSIRTRRDPISPVEAGHAASVLGNVSDICLRLGRKLKWDPAQDRFIGDDEANAMLARPYRSPWTI